MSKINIYCPGDIISGGVNSLHLLCDALNKNGLIARMYYVNPKKEILENKIIKSFNVASVNEIDDSPDNIVIVPETMTSHLVQYQHARKIVYWLSVHFFFKTPPHRFPFTFKPFRKLISCSSYFSATEKPVLKIKRKLSYWNKAKNIAWKPSVLHISNSFYIADFLKLFNINSVQILHNPVREEFYNKPIISVRERIILLGPKTPKFLVNEINEHFKNIKCIRAKRLKNTDLLGLYNTSMLFIELGNSNRDRTIREAVLSGCIVITSNKGGAGVEKDTPLPAFYKINVDKHFRDELFTKIEEICNNYSSHYENMQPYISFLQLEKDNFIYNTNEIFKSIINN